MRRSLVGALAAGCLGLVVVGSAGAVPKPPPKFWSAARCERVLLGIYGYASRVPPGGLGLPTGDGHAFHPGQAFCVGSGGPLACRWTAGHRVRLYSLFTVFSRSPLNGGVARSFTRTTRASPGLVKIMHHAGDQYAGWPADFYMSSVTLLTTNATPARFRTTIAPIAARLMRQETNITCTGG